MASDKEIADQLHEKLFGRGDYMLPSHRAANLVAIESALTAARAEEPPAHPIDTAPKDGTRILAFFPWYGGQWEIARWNDDRYAKKPRPFWSPDTARVLGVAAARADQPKWWRALPPTPGETT